MKAAITATHRLQQQYRGFINTPQLWFGKYEAFTQFKLPEEQNTHYTGEPIQDNLFLGKRSERFLENLIQQSQCYKVLASNVQIKDGKTTIGEIDFIVKDLVANTSIHLEQVCKFYLYDSSFKTEPEQWIGPNRKDTFRQKLDKLNSHQLPLLNHPATQEVLETYSINAKDCIQQVCFMAHCFTPLSLKDYTQFTINPKSVSGHYMTLTTFKKQFTEDDLFAIPKKTDWCVNPEYNEDWLSKSEAILEIETFLNDNRAPLIWIKQNDTFYRVFVVWWPNA
jgi:hypothetical protein